ncbi:MAG TPA: DUF2062 domain-containing protein [candidate division Zixibacteria bacterium]|nr:DUF2062 domain-containing protein [candidate division Zixibacteria bacterium]
MRERLHRLVQPVLDLLTQGVTPEKIALSLTIGAIVGTFPLLGTTTTICTLLAIIFGLNLPAIQLANYAVYPVQLFLLLPAIRVGEKLTHSAPLTLSVAQITAMVRADRWYAARLLWHSAEHALIGWTLFAIPAAFLLYPAIRVAVGVAARSFVAPEVAE